MNTTGTVKVGTFGGGGDIVAKKVTEGNTSYVKIFQREKMDAFSQFFFRLHDSLSTNHINVTVNMEEGKSEGMVTPENKAIFHIQKSLIYNQRLTFENTRNSSIEYYFSSSENNKLFVKDLMNKFTDISVKEEKFSLPISETGRVSEEKILSQNDFEKSLTEDLMKRVDINENLKKEIINSYKEDNYFSEENAKNISAAVNKIYCSNTQNISLDRSLLFLNAKIWQGPDKIPFLNVKTELTENLDLSFCKNIYKQKMGVDWSDEKDGSIISHILEKLISDLPDTDEGHKTHTFLLNVINGSSSSLKPCFTTRIKLHLDHLSKKCPSWPQEIHLDAMDVLTDYD